MFMPNTNIIDHEVRLHLNTLVDICINSIKAGQPMEKAQITEFKLLLSKIRAAKGKHLPMPDIVREGLSCSQGLLMDAVDEGLITRDDQRKFIEHHKNLLIIETGLEVLKHIAPPEFSNFLHEQHKKPFEQRWSELGHLSGVNFEKYLFLVAKKHSLYREMQFAGPAKIKELSDAGHFYDKELHDEAGRLGAELKGRIGAKFANPHSEKRLREFMRPGVGGDEFSKSSMEKLLRNVEALKRKKNLTPPKNMKRRW